MAKSMVQGGWRLIAAGLAAACLAGPAAAENWERYKNPTFGTSVEIPPGVGVFHKSGKGRTWLADDRTVIAVEAEVWTEDFRNWREYHDDHIAGMQDEGITITQNDGDATTFTVWGKKQDGWIYLHVRQSARCPEIAHGMAVIMLKRPNARHRLWIDQMTASLTHRPASKCP